MNSSAPALLKIHYYGYPIRLAVLFRPYKHKSLIIPFIDFATYDFSILP